jgi:uncharacterized membrane protein YhhN
MHRGPVEWTLNLIGCNAFMVSHLALIVTFDIHWKILPLWSILLLIPGILLVGRVLPKMNCRGVSQGFVIAYCCLLQITYAASIGQLCTADSFRISYCLCSLGYLMFLVSDSFLFAREFGVDTKPRRVETMGTYTLAQGFLAFGLALEY